MSVIAMLQLKAGKLRTSPNNHLSPRLTVSLKRFVGYELARRLQSELHSALLVGKNIL